MLIICCLCSGFVIRFAGVYIFFDYFFFFSPSTRKKEEKLDWMYQGPGGMVNRDEYLLGRPIDKYVFEKMEEKEAGCSSETGLLPGSIFAPSGANSLLDMASKIREDPLFIIRY